MTVPAKISIRELAAVHVGMTGFAHRRLFPPQAACAPCVNRSGRMTRNTRQGGVCSGKRKSRPPVAAGRKGRREEPLNRMARPAFTAVVPCGKLTGMGVGMAFRAPVEFAPAEIKRPLHLPVGGDCGMATLACHITVFPLQHECR